MIKNKYDNNNTIIIQLLILTKAIHISTVFYIEIAFNNKFKNFTFKNWKGFFDINDYKT